jgi:hypothetical protein
LRYPGIINPECHLDDDGGPLVIAIETAEPEVTRQSLHVRVGPVFHGNAPGDEPGVWIEYQEIHMASLLQGPVLLTPAVWREMSRAVNRRLRRDRIRRVTRRVRRG